MKTRMVSFVFLSLLISPFFCLSQTHSKVDIDIMGFSFSRFSLNLEPTREFNRYRNSKSWRKELEKNLCWSGVFQLSNSLFNYCPKFSKIIDLRLKISIEKNLLIFALKDNDGTNLADYSIKIVNNKLDDESIMNVINNLTEKLTGIPGILGSTIAFSFKQPERLKIIAKINTHGKNIAAISSNKKINILPVWSHSGNEIVYTAVDRLGVSLIYNGLKGREKILANYRGVNSGGSWFNDDSRLIVTISKNNNADLYEIILKTGKLKRLTTHPAIDTSPSISPDGQYLIFVSDRGGTEQLYLMYMPTREIFRLTFTGIRNTDPKWSHDGNLVTYTKTVAGRDQIYVMDLFGDSKRALTRGPYHSEQPAWSPDNRQIVFSSNRNGNYKLYIIFRDGSGLRRLTNTPHGFDESNPSWTINKFNLN